MSGAVVHPERFRVDDDKVRRYLLDPNHVDGGPKCAFPPSVGCALDDPVTPMAALARHPRQAILTKAYPVPHGLRYHFEGPMPCPDGTPANLRTVWQIDGPPGLRPARSITLKPQPRLRRVP